MNAKALDLLRKASLIVVGGYAVATLYKIGVISAVLPKCIGLNIEKSVESIKRYTEPLTNSGRFKKARSYLTRTYLVSALAFSCSGVGVLCFFKAPYIPIGVPIAISAVSSAALWLAPQAMVIPAGRLALVVAGSTAVGYCFGPLHWVAYDSIHTYNLIVASSVVGVTLPLYLTRGMVAYFLSSQLLSCSLAVAVATSLSPGTDVNVVLTLQILSNFTLGLLHTIPTVYNYLSHDEVTLEKAEDPIGEGYKVFGSVAYGSFQLFRWATSFMIYSLTSSDRKGVTREERQQLRSFANMSIWCERCSNVLASAMFLVFYVKVVSYLQRGGTRPQLNAMRRVFAKLSPLALIS